MPSLQRPVLRRRCVVGRKSRPLSRGSRLVQAFPQRAVRRADRSQEKRLSALREGRMPSLQGRPSAARGGWSEKAASFRGQFPPGGARSLQRQSGYTAAGEERVGGEAPSARNRFLCRARVCACNRQHQVSRSGQRRRGGGPAPQLGKPGLAAVSRAPCRIASPDRAGHAWLGRLRASGLGAGAEGHRHSGWAAAREVSASKGSSSSASASAATWRLNSPP